MKKLSVIGFVGALFAVIVAMLPIAPSPPLLPSLPVFVTAWDPNPEPDIAGYCMYLGSESNQYHGKLSLDLTHQLHGITEQPVMKRADGGPVFVRVSAYNTAGIEGEWSDEVQFPAP